LSGKNKMKILVYLMGLVIGITAFLYILSIYDKGKKQVRKITRKTGPPVNPDNVRFNNLRSVAPGTRMCPLCRSELNKYEALYASQEKTGTGTKILIHGCRYCYRPDKDPDNPEKSVLK